ncbi:MAG: NAD(P)-dependent oxidoreductase [Caldilineaceae bacterium]
MRLLMTGATGRLGQYMIPEFTDLELTVTAPRPLAENPHNVPFIQADLTRFDECQKLMAAVKPQVIVAVGAIPYATDAPTPSPRERQRPFDATMQVNIMGLYYTMMAAVENQVETVIFTGSNVPVLDRDGAYRYLPLDDDHPDAIPTNSYTFTKCADDLMMAWFTRAHGIQTISTRPGWMHTADQMQALAQKMQPATQWDNGLWQYIAYEDVARAHRQILDARAHLPTHDVYLLSAADHRAQEESRELVEKFCPPGLAKTLPPDFGSRESFINCRKAQKAFGYDPQHSWTNYL